MWNRFNFSDFLILCEYNAFYFSEIAFIGFTLHEIKQGIVFFGTPGICYKVYKFLVEFQNLLSLSKSLNRKLFDCRVLYKHLFCVQPSFKYAVECSVLLQSVEATQNSCG